MPQLNRLPFDIERVFIDQSVADLSFTQRIQRNLDYYKIPWLIIEDYKNFIEKRSFDYSFERGKKNLILYPQKGKFLHSCPGSDSVLCCRYHVLDFGSNCMYDCQYCFLQTYLTNPFYMVAANTEFLLNELKSTLNAKNQGHLRVGTGEYTDSLVLDPLTQLSVDLVKTFREIPNATLELKTKSDYVDNLLTVDPQGQIVVSWSVNPPALIEETEIGAPTLSERLEAAKKVSHAGYQLGFHFDPILYTEDWADLYTKTVEEIFDNVDPNKIRWISLGTFRYSPGLKEMLRQRYPLETITRREMFHSKDGKYRYFYPMRVRMYQKIKEEILKQAPDMMVYLCMENRHSWKSVFGFEPTGPFELDEKFENRRQQLIT